MRLYKTGTDPEERHKMELVEPHGTTLVYPVQFEAVIELCSVQCSFKPTQRARRE